MSNKALKHRLLDGGLSSRIGRTEVTNEGDIFRALLVSTCLHTVQQKPIYGQFVNNEGRKVEFEDYIVDRDRTVVLMANGDMVGLRVCFKPSPWAGGNPTCVVDGKEANASIIEPIEIFDQPFVEAIDSQLTPTAQNWANGEMICLHIALPTTLFMHLAQPINAAPIEVHDQGAAEVHTTEAADKGENGEGGTVEEAH